MSNDIKTVDLESEDLVDDRLRQLKKLVPEAFSESGIDFDKLRLLLGDEVDEGDERYAFTWPGKADAIRQSQTSTTATLRPVVEKSRSRDGKDGSFDSDNIYIEGDNLEALKLLQRAYHGKVKMIYIDPPYNTGHDFVYKDKFGDTIENYKKQTGQASQSNPETSGRYHSDWCSMMYPRLKLARELLSDDGAIFISIDDNEETNLMQLCAEIFGGNNFVTKLYVQVNPRGRNLDRYIAKTIEPVLVWVKNYENTSCLNLIPKDDRMLSEYSFEDAKGRFRPIGLRNRNQSFNPSTRPNLYFPLWINPDDGTVALNEDETHTVERLPLASDGTPTCWTWSKEKILAENEYIYGAQSSDGWRVFRKDYLDEGIAAFTMAKSLQTDAEFNNDYGKKRIKELFGANIMSFPKSPFLIKRILQIGSSANSIVMDFFSGSATTADAVMTINAEEAGSRQYIMVQLPETTPKDSTAEQEGFTTIADIGEERIRRAGNKIAEEVAEANKQPKLGEEPKKLPDIGFRVFKLDESGIERSPSGQLTVNLRKEGRSDLDIIFEVMLKWGYELTYPIKKVEFAGYECYSVAEGDLICCMQPGLTVDALEAIAAEQPRRVFIMDSVFEGSDSLKLDALAIFKHAEEQTQQKIELRTV